jgi:hypothetical protein
VFLGVAASSQVAIDGVCNRVSSYGSTVSPTSIFNPVSQYGSQVSPLSAYNPIASTPPFLQCEASGVKMNQVSKNQILLNRIDPDRLCATLAGAGL